jgi:hypothetical protein
MKSLRVVKFIGVILYDSIRFHERITPQLLSEVLSSPPQIEQVELSYSFPPT